MPDFDPTPEQQDLLDHNPARHARVLAGPGTGKSATLVALIDRLLAGNPAPRVRLLTFTRAATGELAKKVSEHPAAAAERPSTIHSFAISTLLRNAGGGNFPSPLRIADKWEAQNIVRLTLARRAGTTVKDLDDLVTEMSANWQSLRPDVDPDVDEATRARFLGAWAEHREIYGYTLLDELPYALRLALEDHPDLAGVDYDLLVVDEYQDLNACDLDVLRLVAERGCAIIGAGDDDQSIYGFRKAAPEGIRRFLEDYPGASDYPLSVTQRCGSRIIRWATFVIVGDPDRPQDRPVLESAEGSPEGEVALLRFAEQEAEADGVAALVRGLVENEGIAPADILVMYRTDHLGRFSTPIRERLAAMNIPCSDPGTVDRILSEPNNRRILAMCRLVANSEDSLAWASLLKMENGIGERFTDYVYDRAREQRCQFGSALLEAHAADFPDGPAGSTRRANEMVSNVILWLENHVAPEQPEGGWGRWITDVAGGNEFPEPSEDLAGLLRELDELIEAGQGLGGYIGQVGPLGRDLHQSQSDSVRIMSMVASKGLTVRAAVIMASEDGIVPRPDCDLGEERRLLYVAMTRAREYLYCTWARRRTGPQARVGRPAVGQLRRRSPFVAGGPVNSERGNAYIRRRFG